MSQEVRFAHLSDWHATTLEGGAASVLRSPKRMSGWASWRFSRRHRHSRRILEAAFRDVATQQVDRVLVTGDLTHISLEQEFRDAAGMLETLGTPDRVFLIPGNHDCYVPVEAARSWDLWADYLRSEQAGGTEGDWGRGLGPAVGADRAPLHADYPTLRLHGRVAFIGLCSSIPTPIFRAGGRLGEEQLARLEALLVRLEERGFCRVVMIHHPVAVAGEPARRALWDGDDFRAVLARVGAELVLHGHKHRRRVNALAGPHGEIPAIGVPSSSEVGSRPEKRAQYHVYSVRPVEPGDEASGFHIDVAVRGYSEESGDFVAVDDSLF